MTTLNRKLQRKTAATYRGRNIIIQLEPSGIVKVREQRCRIWYETSIEAIFSMAGKAYAEEVRKERKEKRQVRRAGR
jgi:hypothetical protein